MASYHEFSFDSLDAVSPANSGYARTDWPMFMMNRPLSNIGAMKILEVQIPFSYYAFNSTNNTFVLNEIGGGSGLVTIPVGNYTTTTLAAAMGAALTAAGSATYTVTYST